MMRLSMALATVLLAITATEAAISTEPPAADALAADNYSSVEAVSGKPVQLNVHASATKDCSPVPMPTIKLLDRPKNGTFTIRRGTLNAGHVANCDISNMPGLAVFYTSQMGYVGQDHAAYEVIDFRGQIERFDFEISVKEEKKT